MKDNKMRTMPLGKLLFSMALPLAISMLVQALYNVVDSIFVAGYSENAITALSLAFPIQNLQIAFASGIAVGMNSLLSKSLGENNPQRVNYAAGNGILLMLVVTFAFMLFGIFGSRAYYNMQQISPETAESGTQYTAICSIFTLGIFVEIMGERLLQASGRTVYTMFTQGTGAIVNIILDPLFIYGGFGIPSMGVAGAAIATVIGQWVAAIMAVIFNLTRNPDVTFSLKYLRPDFKIIGKILAVGIPSIIMMAIGSVMNFGMNQIFLGFPDIGETASGVFGVYFKLQSFFFMPVFGLTNAAISILAYNYGARLPKRITGTLKYTVGAAFVFLLLGLAVFQLFPQTLMGIFNTPGEAHSKQFMEIGVSALRLVSLCFPLAAVGIALGSTFQALGNGVYASITSLCRQLIVLLPVAYLLSLAGDVHLVWWAFPIAEIASVAATVILYARIYRQKIKPLFSDS